MESYVARPEDAADWERRKNFVSRWNRRRKWGVFQREVRADSGMRVLDVGFSDEEYQETDNFIEKHYPYPEMLTALGVDDPKKFLVRYPRVKAVQYAGDVFPFADGAFDLVWSNAVIEHVGDRDSQIRFLREINRVGRRAFVTTPNRHFPVEVHTRTPLLHFLPERVFEAYLRLIGKSWATGSYMRLLSMKDMKMLLREAGIEKYRIIQNRIGFFTLDFVVVVDQS